MKAFNPKKADWPQNSQKIKGMNFFEFCFM